MPSRDACGVGGLRVAVVMMVMGLGIVCWLIAATLIGIAASLDARRRWSQMSERARRFVKSERFKSSPPGNTRKLATARSPR